MEKKNDTFDNCIENADVRANAIQWLDIRGNPVSDSSKWTRNDRLGQTARVVEKGRSLGT